MVSSTAPSSATSRTQIWVMGALAWHGALGAAFLILGLLVLVGGIHEIAGFGIALDFSNPLARIIAIGLCLVYGSIQLRYWPGLRAYRTRAWVMSLVINFISFLALLFLTFRQMTCQGGRICPASTNPFAADRFEMWFPFLIVLLAFGIMLIAMWRKDVGALYHETPRLRSALTAYLYISPYLLIASVFTFGLLLYAFVLGFTKFSNEQLYGGESPIWTGLDNYRQALKNDEFLISLSNVIWYSFIVVCFQTVISLGLALMMNGRFKGRRLFRTLFYAPSVTSSVVISLIFLWLFNGRGIINYVLYDLLNMGGPLGNLGLRTPNTNWLNTPTRLGDMIYLKPFLNQNWNLLLLVPLVIAAISVGLRVILWLRDNMLNWKVVRYAGVSAAATAIVVFAGLGLFSNDTNNFVAAKALLIAVASGFAGGLVGNYLKLEPDQNTAIRSAVTGTLAATLLFSILTEGGAVSSPLTTAAFAYASLLIPVLVGPLVAAFTASITHGRYMPKPTAPLQARTIKKESEASFSLVRGAKAIGPALLGLLVIWCVLVLFAATATEGITRPSDLSAERIDTLLFRGPSVALMIIMLLNIFTTSPTFMIMFLAALQDVPVTLYEAARVDGANRWQQFRHITLPMLRPVTLLIVVLGTIGTLQIFDQVHVMTAGGPVNTTLTPVYLIFTKAIGDQRPVAVGAASAMAFLLGAMIFLFTFLQRRYIERGTEQY